jgi:regulator of replication initiation timing
MYFYLNFYIVILELQSQLTRTIDENNQLKVNNEKVINELNQEFEESKCFY